VLFQKKTTKPLLLKKTGKKRGGEVEPKGNLTKIARRLKKDRVSKRG